MVLTKDKAVQIIQFGWKDYVLRKKDQQQEKQEIANNRARVFLTAVSDGDVELITAFIVDGYNVNTPDFWGRLPLHYAISMRNFDVIELLLKNGADPDLKTKEGANAFDVVYHIAFRDSSSPWFRPLMAWLEHIEKLNYIIDLLKEKSKAPETVKYLRI